MIAVDSSVLIDIIGDDAVAGDAADAALRRALSTGPVVACEVVLAEVVAGLGNGSVVVEALEEMGIDFQPLEQRSAVRAGEMQRRYNERRRAAGEAGPGPRTVPDFLIGAHALLQCQGLITRDAGFYRDYFKGLKVIVPKAP
ncbi:MAG: type II toxin-antitoxin system VapC family toxin [Rubrivivax sp.]|nr:type II toxin-antitoxin system VapC family toxin [Rubrivivax sp.]